MSTMTLAGIRTLTRDGLNELSTASLSGIEIDAVTNDGIKEASAKGLCCEVSHSLTLRAGERIYRVPNGDRVLHVDHDGIGLINILPNAVGYANTESLNPTGPAQFWFQWGDFIVIEPAANSAAAGKITTLYCASRPAAVLSGETASPAIPSPFHEPLLDRNIAFCAIKLKRWADFVAAYNRYTGFIQHRRFEIIHRIADPKGARELPESVTMEIKQ